MNQERIDFGPTGWDLDPEHERELTARIAAAAETELARRSTLTDSTVDLTRWLRPVLAAAAVLAAVSVVTLQRTDRQEPPPDAGTADALNLPRPVAEWISRDSAPAMGELIAIMNESEE